ncbi:MULTISPECIES: phosphonate ABC transporter ATP-binding protein [Haloarcula]|uniref:Phosphonate ABC transporter ATP-binding protein n=4 Tax=Haloarcula TaxID=2237 RepID=A0A482TUC0_HALHI|nr:MULTISPECIES: phosphonate ABC transporter ATP-binding protein [Haloarcula]AEM59066.1 phosphonate ABC transporter ATP-binding protein [Haloarcula hispanica ATCC 33960]AHB67761.1 phosphonate ABC transporter ATP-binding protein [Haloarcula hispanica N601]AJF24292.1 phosphonate ABC transporter ATP-binding protein [Haloarcula sp. CBA1115]EMA23845.1 phosphonate ABC transporter ATP-binding protein [Haloarcula amylolytica JCM 13557]KAA9400873.1 phosphonate ABC transporter ATP-binding protein [Haloa
MLTVDNLEKTYDSGDKALKGVSFEVSGNEIVAIIGPSGAGKSTLVRSINRLTEPTGGRVSLDDTEVTGLDKSALRDVRRDMGMIFQEFNLVERLTVMENILSGRLGYLSTWNAFRRNFPPEDIKRAREILSRVNLEGVENNRADELSGGQRQRVGIARAVIQRPKILLADEPTSALDPDTSREVMSLLTDIAHEDDIPIIINIHEVDLAVDYADRIIGLSDGEIVFNGPPDDLDQAARDEIYRGGESIADREEPSAGSSTGSDDVIAERGD